MVRAQLLVETRAEAEHRPRRVLGQQAEILSPHTLLRRADMVLAQQIYAHPPQQRHCLGVVEADGVAFLDLQVKVPAQSPGHAQRTLQLGPQL